MNLTTALSLLEINNGDKLTEELLHKQFRRVLRKNHPDLGGSTEKAQQISEANIYLGEYLGRAHKMQLMNKQSKLPIAIIEFEALNEILDGKSSNILVDGQTIQAYKSALVKYECMIEISVSLNINGLQYNYTVYQEKNALNSYNVYCKIPVSDMAMPLYITASAYGKEVTFNLTNKSIDLKLRYDTGAKLKVMMERQLIQDGQ